MDEINKTRQSVEKGADHVTSIAEDALNKGKDYLNETKDRATDLLEEIQGRGTDAWSDAKSWVKKNPALAVGGALAVGVILSALLLRNNED